MSKDGAKGDGARGGASSGKRRRLRPGAALSLSEIGRLGGIARKKKLTPEERAEIARTASRARWDKVKADD